MSQAAAALVLARTPDGPSVCPCRKNNLHSRIARPDDSPRDEGWDMLENRLPEGEATTAERHRHGQRPSDRDAAPASPPGMKSAILNALPAHIAHLDRDGTITALNEAWKRLRLGDRPGGGPAGVGSNYFALCEQSRDHFGDKAPLVARGLRAVLAG